MADKYPNVYIGFSEQENEAPDHTGGTIADADFINAITDTIYQLEVMVGLVSDGAGTVGHEARIKKLEAKNAVKITFSTAAPVAPVLTDVWVDTTAIPWFWKAWNGSSWQRMGAEAIAITGKLINTTAPVDGQVLTYENSSGEAKWKTPAAAIGFANPMTTPGDIIIGGAAGVATRLASGTTGQLLSYTTTGIAWQTPNFLSSPSGAAQGDVLYYNGSAWVRLPPGTTGQFLKTLGASNNPLWSDLPSSPPGSAIAAPAGVTQGSILVFDGVNWTYLGPGLAGEFLKTQGTGAMPTWATPAGGSGMTNPMTNLGDIIISGDGSGTPARLPVGSSGQVLKVVGTAPAWATETGFANPMTTPGDLILGGTSGAPGRLAIGTNSQVLKVVSGAVVWAAETGFTNPMTTTGDLILAGGSGAPGRLAIGTTGQILGVVSGTAAWGSLASFGALSNPMTTPQDIIVGGTSGAPGRLPVGGLGQVLGVVAGIGGVPTVGWAAPPAGGSGAGLTNPMTTAGDIIIGGVSGVAIRLGKGTTGQVLTVDGSGNVGWQAATGGGSSDPLDLAYRATPTTPASGFARVYANTAGFLSLKNAAGNVYTMLHGIVPDSGTGLMPPEPYLNLIAGTNVTISRSDNSAQARSDITINASGGGGTAPSGTKLTAPPTWAGGTWTAFNGTGLTVTDQNNGVHLHSAAVGGGATQLRGISLAYPSGDFQRVCKFSQGMIGNGFPMSGPFISDGTKVKHFVIYRNGTSVPVVDVRECSTVTTAGGSAGSAQSTSVPGMDDVWLRIRHDGTGGHRYYEFSNDGGQYWQIILDEPLGAQYLAPTLIGFAVSNFTDGQPVDSTLMSWDTAAPTWSY